MMITQLEQLQTLLNCSDGETKLNSECLDVLRYLLYQLISSEQEADPGNFFTAWRLLMENIANKEHWMVQASGFNGSAGSTAELQIPSTKKADDEIMAKISSLFSSMSSSLFSRDNISYKFTGLTTAQQALFVFATPFLMSIFTSFIVFMTYAIFPMGPYDPHHANSKDDPSYVSQVKQNWYKCFFPCVTVVAPVASLVPALVMYKYVVPKSGYRLYWKRMLIRLRRTQANSSPPPFLLVWGETCLFTAVVYGVLYVAVAFTFGIGTFFHVAVTFFVAYFAGIAWLNHRLFPDYFDWYTTWAWHKLFPRRRANKKVKVAASPTDSTLDCKALSIRL